MPLAEHLHPKTYWEERAELTELAIVELLNVIAMHSAPALAEGLRSVIDHWNENHRKLADRYPAPAAGMNSPDGGATQPDQPKGGA